MEIPKQVQFVVEQLEKQGFEAYIVGGCVRDLLRGNSPKDWDIATSAKPDEIVKIFPDSYLDNNFGTVRVAVEDEDFQEIEITPFRVESKYSDKRHPDKIEWAETIEQDLGRRDFTVNAMAATPEASKLKIKREKLKVIDLFEGQKDLENKVIRAVGDAEDRFQEDALRLARAVRFVATLGEGWKIEAKTKKAIQKNSGLLNMVSRERVRDEFMKIIMSERAGEGIELLQELGLLKHIIPELEDCRGIDQSKHHIYNVYEHLVRSLKYAVQKNYSKYVRLSALFHDIGKPITKRGKGEDATFYNHEIVGAKITARILQRLRFSRKDIEKVVKLVRYHLFYYNVEEVGEASVRRLVRQVGIENMEELLQLRFCDRIGSGVPKAEPYKLRHLKYLIEKVRQDPISVKKLKLRGDDVIKILEIRQGPKVGAVLDILLGKVLEDPKKNTKEFLENEIEKLGKLSDSEIFELGKKAIKERQTLEMKRDEMTKSKYWVT
ncbi:CCA tRNA nucleotidyltransferase [Candidatus Parcubacteria bacterium]|nr:CCA tRNA nucleotidyltransferase [Candidatus Parcubacteria bacterium]